MPAHLVGSLDAWLEGPFSGCSIGTSALQVCQGQTRSRTSVGVPSRSLPASNCEPVRMEPLITNNWTAIAQDDVGQAASALTAAGRLVDSSSLSIWMNDKLLETPNTYFVVSHGAASFKRKSLLSEQLRSATSLPLPNCDYDVGSNDNIASTADAHNSVSIDDCVKHQSSPKQGHAESCLPIQDPPPAPGGTIVPERESVAAEIQAGPTAVLCGVKARGNSPFGAPPSSPSNDKHHPLMLVLGCSSSMDADISSTCGGGGSLACSSSTGCYSSSSNVLHYCRGEQDDGFSEQLYLQQHQLQPQQQQELVSRGLPAVACTAAAASAASLQVAVVDKEKPPVGLVVAVAEPATAVPTPSSLAAAAAAPQLLQGCPAVDAPSVTAAPASPDGGATAATAASRRHDGDESPDSVSSLAVCSFTDLISGGSCSLTSKGSRPRNAVQLTLAAHLVAVCDGDTSDDAANKDVNADVALASEAPCLCNMATAVPKTATEVASKAMAEAEVPSMALHGPEPTCSVAAAAVTEASPQDWVLTAGPTDAAAVAAQPHARGSSDGVLPGGVGDSIAAAAEEAQRETQPEVQLSRNESAPNDVQVEVEVGERQQMRSDDETLAAPEGSRRGGSRSVPFASLFPTVLVLPAAHGGAAAAAIAHPGGGHAAQPYGITAGYGLQHSLSMSQAELQYGSLARVEEFWGPATAAAITASAAAAIDARLRGVISARRSFDVSKAQLRAKAWGGGGGSRDSINGLLEADVQPAMYEGTVRRGLPRKAAAALARSSSQSVPEESRRSVFLLAAPGEPEDLPDPTG